MTEATRTASSRDVYIVGGANSAGQAAVYLAQHAKRSVTILVARQRRWTSSMSYYLIQQIAAIENITVRTCTEVVAGGRRRTPGTD